MSTGGTTNKNPNLIIYNELGFFFFQKWGWGNKRGNKSEDLMSLYS